MTAVQHPVANGVHQMADPAASYPQATAAGQDGLATEQSAPAPPSAPTSTVSADTSFEAVNQVAWAFIEQYYTTLGKNPDKLYLLYKSSSFFTCGHDGESSPCGNGITQIQERVKALNCKNAKFRLTNIDAQPSESSILIQAIGDFCRTSGTAQRFVQTFVLARQTNGYYVLNDIFRSLNEVGTIADEDAVNDVKIPVSDNAPSEPTAAATSTISAATEPAIETADEEEPVALKSEAAVATTPQPVAPVINEPEAPADEVEAKAEPVAEEADEPVSELAQPEATEAAAPAEPEAAAAPEPADEEPAVASADEVPAVAAPEVWKPRVAQEAAAASASEAAFKPTVPKTWASLAASANKSAPAKSAATAAVAAAAPATVASTASTPAVAAPTAIPAATTKPNAAPQPAQTQAQASIKPTPVTSAATNGTGNPDSESDGWVAVGNADSKRGRGNISFNGAEPRAEPEFRGYIKNVIATVSVADLKTALAKFEVTYLDISRPKNCAFVDFGSQRALTDAINASPYTIGEEQIYVEERRASRGGFQSRNGPPIRHMRNGPQQPLRGGFNKEGRGSYTGRGNRGHTFRGRGQA